MQLSYFVASFSLYCSWFVVFHPLTSEHLRKKEALSRAFEFMIPS